MTPESISSTEPSAPTGMGEASRLVGVLLEPARTFEDVARKPSFWTPLILLILASFVYMYLLSNRLGWENIMHQGMQMNARAQRMMEQLPADQRQLAEERQLKFAPISSYAGAVVGPPIAFVIVAAVLLAIVKIMSAPIRFK